MTYALQKGSTLLCFRFKCNLCCTFLKLLLFLFFNYNSKVHFLLFTGPANYINILINRYIEIFRSSLAEIRAQTGPKIRPLMSEIIPRPAPYDRGDRFGGPNRLGGRGPPPPSVPPPRARGKC